MIIFACDAVVCTDPRLILVSLWMDCLVAGRYIVGEAERQVAVITLGRNYLWTLLLNESRRQVIKAFSVHQVLSPTSQLCSMPIVSALRQA